MPSGVEVLAKLDFREKGGYMRAVVPVQHLDGGPTVRALVYSVATGNPNFDARMIKDLDAAARVPRARRERCG